MEQENFPSKRMAAGGLIRCADQILIVEPTYKLTWEIPGGIVERDESPRAALHRELQEELGVDAKIGRLLVVEYQTATKENLDSLKFIFDVEWSHHSNDLIALPPDELRSYKFVNSDELDRYLIDRLAQRVRLAIDADRRGLTIYAENGKSYGI